jgi:hypothetical protein
LSPGDGARLQAPIDLKSRERIKRSRLFKYIFQCIFYAIRVIRIGTPTGISFEMRTPFKKVSVYPTVRGKVCRYAEQVHPVQTVRSLFATSE